MAERVPPRRVDGLLLVDKPVGPTSNAVLQRVKRLYNAAKAGHGGTLDPMASGLLAIVFGEAAKFSSALLEGDKTYTGVVQLGVTTTTGDAEGDVLERRAVDPAAIDLERLRREFSGEITQTPPSYSAIKVDGRPLYAYAREGATVAAQPRQVRIEKLELTFAPPDRLRFVVVCGGGTYIRSLAEDIGRTIGCGAHLAELRRVASGPLTLQSSVAYDVLESLSAEQRVAKLLPPDALLYGLPRLELDAATAANLIHGRRADAPAGQPAGKSKVYVRSGQFLGVVEVTSDGRLVPVRLMATGSAAGGAGNPH
jgi:tRNA pseudouridine55 synthase